MTKLEVKLHLSKIALGKSVVAINPRLEYECAGKNKNALFFGVKDTAQIPEHVLQKLRNSPKMIWHTIDKAADKGRAIDTDLTNPLTYRIMTGSTSGGPINILKGINDFAIGTDGGGSVLGPAISCQLPSMIGAGLGLLVKNEKTSTDGHQFRGSIGVIAKNLSTVAMVMELLTEQSLTVQKKRKQRVMIPKANSVIGPDNQDMHEKIMRYLSSMDHRDYDFEEVDMTGIEHRHVAIKLIQKIFHEKEADLILTCEGPVDVYGYGETIPQQFGKAGMDITEGHGKFLLRAANMCETTAISVPTDQLATGLVVIAKKGLEQSRYALRFARELEQRIKLPDVWRRYFLNEEHQINHLTF